MLHSVTSSPSVEVVVDMVRSPFLTFGTIVGVFSACVVRRVINASRLCRRVALSRVSLDRLTVYGIYLPVAFFYILLQASCET